MSEQPKIRQRLQNLRERYTPKLGAPSAMPSPADFVELIDCLWELNNPKPKASITINNLTPPDWQRRVAEGLVKPGQRPKLPNMAGQRPSYWRRVWNALRGH